MSIKASLYDPSSAELAEPLLLAQEQQCGDQEETHEPPELDEPMLRHLKLSSLVLGTVVGCFIQLSTLGASSLLVRIWGDSFLFESKNDKLALSVLWSIAVSAVAVVVLESLRLVVSTTYNATAVSKRSNKQQAEEALDELMLHMDSQYVTGCLMGVCLLWTLTEIMLGIKTQILYFLTSLFVTLFAWRGIRICSANNSRIQQQQRQQQQQEEEDSEAQRGRVTIVHFSAPCRRFSQAQAVRYSAPCRSYSQAQADATQALMIV